MTQSAPLPSVSKPPAKGLLSVARTHTVALQGIEAVAVEVQAQVRPGITAFQIVGLPDSAVREAKERVQAAFHSLGIRLPAKRITINLAPADIAKEGSLYDLPIAMALLTALGALPESSTDGALFIGELALDGRLNPVRGALAAALHASNAGLEAVYVPQDNGGEAAWADDIAVYAPASLADIVTHLKGQESLTPCQSQVAEKPSTHVPDFADVKGQESAKRAALIAAAGGHNLILSGPPGSGKSMIARRLLGILPPLAPAHALEASLIHSAAGMLTSGLVKYPPLREPHHSASAVALTGGGHLAKPGEISLAHRGVLFLDELPEFPRKVLETLRQPLENGTITVSRANAHVAYPARFQLIAAMNPCPCGYLGHPKTPCTDTPKQVQTYKSRISGPLMDRIDLHVDVSPVPYADLASLKPGESSESLRAKVLAARKRQHQRLSSHGLTLNAEVDGTLLDTLFKPSADGLALLEKAANAYNLSARGWQRILRLARTIADLAGDDSIERGHIAEALSFRPQG